MEILRRDHARFRRLVRERVEYLLATTPQEYLDRYWCIACYNSIEAFARHFPDPRTEGLDKFEEEHDTVRRLYRGDKEVTADIDLTVIMPPDVLPWH